MREWKHGYYAESGYTYGYYGELLPRRLAWVAAMRGHATDLGRFRYLDLGCGQGYGLCLLASLYPKAEFTGVDFLPEHVAHARSLAGQAGLENLSFIEGDFADLATDPGGLGSFDFASAHGISSWIGADVREKMFTVVEKTLNPGGLFYNSYNTHPGWLAAMPLQNLIMLEQEHCDGPTAQRRARAKMQQLSEGGAALFGALPGLKSRVDALDQHDPSYLLQEYNNQFWRPLFVAEMMQIMSAHKMNYLGSATLAESFDFLLPANIQRLLEEQDNPLIRETLRDYALAQSFRRDVYAKGRNPLWPAHRIQRLEDTRVVANPLTPRPGAGQDFSIKSGALSFDGGAQAFTAVLDAAATPVSVGTLVSQGLCKTLQDAVQAVTMLVQGGWLEFAPESVDVGPAQRLNACILTAVLNGAPYRHLAIPQVGTAVPLGELDLFLAGLHLTGTPAGGLPAALSATLERNGRQLNENGQPVTEPVRRRELLAEHAENFATLRPLLEAAGAIATV